MSSGTHALFTPTQFAGVRLSNRFVSKLAAAVSKPQIGDGLAEGVSFGPHPRYEPSFPRVRSVGIWNGRNQYLASRRASYLSGVVVDADGGGRFSG